ncbi:hypothetical protein ACO0QE_001472 [Hanseniaspora vineae]
MNEHAPKAKVSDGKGDLLSPLDNIRNNLPNRTKVTTSKLQNSNYKRYSTSSFVSVSSLATNNTLTNLADITNSSYNGTDKFNLQEQNFDDERLLDNLNLSSYEEDILSRALQQQRQQEYQETGSNKIDFVRSPSCEWKKNNSRIDQRNISSSSVFSQHSRVPTVCVPAAGFASLSVSDKPVSGVGPNRNRQSSVHQRNFSTGFINSSAANESTDNIMHFDAPKLSTPLASVPNTHKRSESWSIQRSHINDVDTHEETVQVFSNVKDLMSLPRGKFEPKLKVGDIIDKTPEKTMNVVTPNASTTKFQFPAQDKQTEQTPDQSYVKPRTPRFKTPSSSRHGSFSSGTTKAFFQSFSLKKSPSVTPNKHHSASQQSKKSIPHLHPPLHFAANDNAHEKSTFKHHKKKSSTFSIKNMFKASPKPSPFADTLEVSSEDILHSRETPLKKTGFVYVPPELPSPPRPPQFYSQTSFSSAGTGGKKLIESEPLVSSEDRIKLAIDLKFKGQYKESTDQLFMACQENDKMAFLLYGLALKLGTGIMPNPAESLRYIKRACGINNKEDEQTIIFEKSDKLDPYELSLNHAIAVPDVPPEPLAPALYEAGLFYLKGPSGHSDHCSSPVMSNASAITPSSNSAHLSGKSPAFSASTGSLSASSTRSNNSMTESFDDFEVDELRALRYLELSASLGNTDSILLCGSIWCKEKPTVRPKDLVRAAAWFRIAESKGCRLTGSDWIYREKYMDKEKSTSIMKKRLSIT